MGNSINWQNTTLYEILKPVIKIEGVSRNGFIIMTLLQPTKCGNFSLQLFKIVKINNNYDKNQYTVWGTLGTLRDPSGLLETLREPLNIHAPLGTDKLESQLMGKNF